MAGSTHLEALTAELLGDVGLLHDELRNLSKDFNQFSTETLPKAMEATEKALQEQRRQLPNEAQRIMTHVADAASQDLPHVVALRATEIIQSKRNNGIASWLQLAIAFALGVVTTAFLMQQKDNTAAVASQIASMQSMLEQTKAACTNQSVSTTPRR